MSNDDNTRPENDVILRTASIDNDVITEFNSDGSEGASVNQTIISESYKSIFNELNKINVSNNSCGNDNGSPLISSGSPLVITGISKSVLTTTAEDEDNSLTTSSDVYENNWTIGNESNINDKVLEFFL